VARSIRPGDHARDFVSQGRQGRPRDPTQL
jgi:hypothetical protein